MPLSPADHVISTRDRFRAFLGRLGISLLLTLQWLAYWAGLKKLYFRGLAALVRRTGLFDERYYLSTYPDVAESGQDALMHYVAYGNREMRSPNPLFQPAAYLKHGSRLDAVVSCLLHYVWVGRHLGYSPSPWFDIDYYLTHYQDVARSGVDPLLHFLMHGGEEGRSPSAHFDPRRYLIANPGLAGTGENLLLHYLNVGRFDLDQSSLGNRPGTGSPVSEEVWKNLPRRSGQGGAVIDVIIPVYRNKEQTLACLYSVLSSANQVDYELVVLNDASPDAELVAELRRLAGEAYFSYFEQESNLGFVATVNRGMTLHEDRDVVLLNSDTEVYGDWLDRLCQAAVSQPRVGTVTPLSNNATLCSYPQLMQDNPVPLEMDYAALDKAARTVNQGKAIETPTAVGFCMYISRACLSECGEFDAVTFGRGYGEENDFSQRARSRGWHNLIAADLFVRHWGSSSFKGAKAQLAHQALRAVNRRHPNYRKEVRKFVRQDPLRSAREALDWARLEACAMGENALIIRGERGGIAARSTVRRTQRHKLDGRGAFFLELDAHDTGTLHLFHPKTGKLPNLQPFRCDELDGLKNALIRLRITTVEVHNLPDLPAESRQKLCLLARALPARLEFYLYDYWSMCPRSHLVRHAQYCGEPNEAGCDQCLRTGRFTSAPLRISSWRAESRKLLEQADGVYVPHDEVRKRMAGHFSGLPIFVWPLEPDGEIMNFSAFRPRADGTTRVVVVGMLTKLRGYEIVLACAGQVKARGLPIEFVLLGYSLDDARLIDQGVRVTGHVPDQSLLQRLAELAPDLVWIASISPEAHSYALTLALQMVAPIATFDVGPAAARLRQAGRGEHLWPVAWMRQPEQIVAALSDLGSSSVSRDT